jgi:aspartate carbamoyltransferase catalytic subunit
MSSETQHLLDIADLSDADIARVLDGPDPEKLLPPTTIVGLLFLEASLRTRYGFASAAVRLGANPLSVTELRYGAEMSSSETFADTLRGVAGMSDLVVARSGSPLDRRVIRDTSPCPVINGGDRGGEHPTQGLIDLAAIERFAGPAHQLNVGICGDMTMRASTSLLELLDRRPPRTLRLIGPPSRLVHRVNLAAALQDRTTTTDVVDFSDLDVVLMTGLAPGRDGGLSAGERADYALTQASIKSLSDRAVVLSPMPVIDEISDDVRTDSRVRIHEHSDLGVTVRMAVLQLLLADRLQSA